MDYIAESKNIQISPRKVRLVVESVKKNSLREVLASLHVLNKRASLPVKKTIESAIANAVNNFKVNKEDLVIKEMIVNEGVVYKRYHYAGRGRTRPYKKRTSHIRVVLSEKTQPVKTVVASASTDIKNEEVRKIEAPKKVKEAKKTSK